MEQAKTLSNEAPTTKATGKDAFRARLCTHLNQAEIDKIDRIDRLLDAEDAGNEHKGQDKTMTIKKQKITNDDWKLYFVGQDWNKTSVIGSKRAAKISYELGCTAIDREGALYCAAVIDGMRGTPRLFRMHP